MPPDPIFSAARDGDNPAVIAWLNVGANPNT